MTSPSRTPIFTPSPGRLCVVPFEDGISPSGRLIVVRNPNEKPVMGRVSEIALPQYNEVEGAGAFVPITVSEYLDRVNQWQLRVGDTVLFGSNSGLEIKVDGERRIILRESEVLAKVEWQEDAQEVPREDVFECEECGIARYVGESNCPNPECSEHRL